MLSIFSVQGTYPTRLGFLDGTQCSHLGFLDKRFRYLDSKKARDFSGQKISLLGRRKVSLQNSARCSLMGSLLLSGSKGRRRMDSQA